MRAGGRSAAGRRDAASGYNPFVTERRGRPIPYYVCMYGVHRIPWGAGVAAVPGRSSAQTREWQMGTVVEVKGLVKRFGALAAVDDVSFAIEEGEVFGLLGPNGAGKTTTISMISRLIDPTDGRITVDGHDAVRESMAVKSVLGVVPQEVALYPTLTAAENLQFWGRMYGLRGADLRRCGGRRA